MAVFIFKSTDTGAPSVSGEVDKLRALFQALLVDGYNSHTSGLSIARSGSTATVTKTSHGYVTGQVIRNGGWDQTEYNIDAVVTVTGANTYTYAVSGSPATPGTGTGTAKVCPLDWTQPYTGTNKGAFKMRTASNQFYLRVDDSNAQNTQVRGYETMTDVDTGTNLFPTNAQITVGSGLYFYKSSAASSTARAWKCWSNGKFIILVVNTDGSNLWTPFLFGDFVSYKSGDAYNCLCNANATSSATTNTNVNSGYIAPSADIGAAGHYIARAHGGASGAITSSKVAEYRCAPNSSSAQQIGSLASATYPAPIEGGVIFGPVFLSESQVLANGYRGRVPGLYAPAHQRPVTSGDTFSGASGTIYDGMTFEATAWGVNGQAFIQTSDWGSY